MSLTAQVTNKLSSPSTNNKNRLTKTPKEKRRASKQEKEAVTPLVSTQWYTNDNFNGNASPLNTTPVIELRQEVSNIGIHIIQGRSVDMIYS